MRSPSFMRPACQQTRAIPRSCHLPIDTWILPKHKSLRATGAQRKSRASIAMKAGAPLRGLAAASGMLCLAVSLLLEAGTASAIAAKNVLILYSNNRLVPGNVAVDRGLVAALSSGGGRTVRIYSEFLDQPEFSGNAYEDLVVAYLHGKYAASPPDAMVAVSDSALSFVVRRRAQLFPNVPIIYAAVSADVLQSFRPLPADIIGVANDYDYSGTITQALRWHPNARRLVVVTGASSEDLAVEAILRRDVPAIVDGVTAEFWAGLPAAVLQERLSHLGSDAVVFTVGFFQDGDGNRFIPRDAAAL